MTKFVRYRELPAYGVTYSRTHIQNLVKGPWGTASADTLAKFNATSIVIPEVDGNLTMPVAGKDQPLTETLVYRDIHLDGVTARSERALQLSGKGLSGGEPESGHQAVAEDDDGGICVDLGKCGGTSEYCESGKGDQFAETKEAHPRLRAA